MSLTEPFAKTLHKDQHTRRFTIVPEPTGWRVVERADETVVRDRVLTDWHRVERIRRTLTVEVSALKAEGWLERG